MAPSLSPLPLAVAVPGRPTSARSLHEASSRLSGRLRASCEGGPGQPARLGNGFGAVPSTQNTVYQNGGWMRRSNTPVYQIRLFRAAGRAGPARSRRRIRMLRISSYGQRTVKRFRSAWPARCRALAWAKLVSGIEPVTSIRKTESAAGSKVHFQIAQK